MIDIHLAIEGKQCLFIAEVVYSIIHQHSLSVFGFGPNGGALEITATPIVLIADHANFLGESLCADIHHLEVLW